ncbi:MAG: NAD(+)/NADH kinase, partial [Chloroflexota bacterium]|nr:NAD(+)/NADH kinase [Chloroflexota bacterium]
MTRIGFAFNPTKPQAVELRDRALAWCGENGIESWSAEAGAYAEVEARLVGTDCLVVLGGDGTF